MTLLAVSGRAGNILNKKKPDDKVYTSRFKKYPFIKKIFYTLKIYHPACKF